MFENIGNDANVFAPQTNSPEYLEFQEKIVVIVQTLIQSELKEKQRQLLWLFIDREKTKYDISKILGRNNSTIQQNYNLIVKKISIALINNKDFLDLVNNLQPEYLKTKMLEWIKETKKTYRIQVYRCPVCKMKCKNKFFVKKHIIGHTDEDHKKYHKQQLDFIKNMLELYGFSVKWIYQHDDYLLFSISWIWTFWRKHYAGQSQKTLFTLYGTQNQDRQ